MNKLVLIIEDEPEVLVLLHRILAPRGFEITEALGGAMALELLTQTSPDIILLDLAMPGIDGLALLASIQTMAHLQNSKVVVVTARPQLALEARNYDVAAILYKPIRPLQLVNLLETLI